MTIARHIATHRDKGNLIVIRLDGSFEIVSALSLTKSWSEPQGGQQLSIMVRFVRRLGPLYPQRSRYRFNEDGLPSSSPTGEERQLLSPLAVTGLKLKVVHVLSAPAL